MNFEKFFEEFDTNGDGVVDKNEFIAGMKKVTGLVSGYDGIFGFIFNCVDESEIFHKKSGKLNKKEFARICKILPQDCSNKQYMVHYMTFKLVDSNDNGEIDKKEMKGFLKKINAVSKPDDIQLIFDRIDTNGDGVISFEEFHKFLED